MKFTYTLSLLAAIGLASAAPAPEAEPNKCGTSWKTSTVTTTSSCPLVSLPLSPIVTGTLVPVKSILSDVGLSVRAPEPTAAPAMEVRNDCWVYSTKTVTTTVKPTCGIVNA